MDINRANEISNIVNKIKRYEKFLESLTGRSYPDEFTIYYRGFETCELEESALELLIDYYNKKLEKAKKELEKF